MEILNADSTGVERAVRILKNGGLVAFPTETVYGLGCDVFNEDAVKRLFEVKKRPRSKPLIVGVSDMDEVHEIAEVNRDAERLMNAFFPGPLTIVFKKRRNIPDIVTGGSDKVAVRMPDHEVPLKLIEKLGKPIVVPSANITGRPSPMSYTHVIEDIGDKIDAVIVGECSVGIESTIVDVTTKPARVLRLGAVRVDDLRKHLDVVLETWKREVYFVSCPVYLFLGSNAVDRILEFASKSRDKGLKVAVIAKKDIFENTIVVGTTLKEYSANIFNAVRKAESMKPDLIVIEGPDVEHEGLMDRLYRLAGERVFKT